MGTPPARWILATTIVATGMAFLDGTVRGRLMVCAERLVVGALVVHVGLGRAHRDTRTT